MKTIASIKHYDGDERLVLFTQMENEYRIQHNHTLDEMMEIEEHDYSVIFDWMVKIVHDLLAEETPTHTVSQDLIDFTFTIELEERLFAFDTL